jgi:hypothetical protein
VRILPKVGTMGYRKCDPKNAERRVEEWHKTVDKILAKWGGPPICFGEVSETDRRCAERADVYWHTFLRSPTGASRRATSPSSITPLRKASFPNFRRCPAGRGDAAGAERHKQRNGRCGDARVVHALWASAAHAVHSYPSTKRKPCPATCLAKYP